MINQKVSNAIDAITTFDLSLDELRILIEVLKTLHDAESVKSDTSRFIKRGLKC